MTVLSEFDQIHVSMTGWMREASKALAAFLERHLPPLHDDWWKQLVINNLSSLQKQDARQHNQTTLASLDLAALLRVLEKNWESISSAGDLPREYYSFVREMQSIRNRWVHMSAEEITDEDIYRDLDTLHRFLSVISADSKLVQEIRARKKALREKEVLLPTSKTVNSHTPTQERKALNRRTTAEWDESLLVATIANEAGSVSGEVAREIIEWAKTHGFHMEWGSGRVICNGFLMLDQKRNFPRALAVVSNGYFYVVIDFLRRIRPFLDEQWLEEARQRFQAFSPASPLSSNTLKIPLTTFRDRYVLNQLLTNLEWIAKAVRNA